MQKFVGTRLSAMMFLEFFVWGSWYVTVGNYMAAIGMSDAIYWAYTVGPIAAMVSPIFLGMVADRFFASERVLGVLQVLSGVVIAVAPFAAEGESASPVAFVLLLQLHMLFYMPTLGLVNTLAFHNMTNQEKQFPLIRVFGTIGWIVANVVVSKWLEADATAVPLQIAGGAAVLLGIYSFTLPHTPPPAKGKRVSLRDVFCLDALVLLKGRSFLVFMVCSFLICIPLAAYYAYAPVFVSASGVENPAFYMSFGQMSEIFFMLIMPFFFVRLGVKWMLFVGMAAWVTRYGLFTAAVDQKIFWMILTGVILHGICYDFFFVTGQIYVDKKVSPAIRGQAQGFLVQVTQGLGMFAGAQVFGRIFNDLTGEGAEAATDWKSFWLIPAIFAGVIMVVFAVLFKDDTKKDAGKAEG
jgi:nucleoside transporter